MAANTVPVLLMHHERDERNVCWPADLPLIRKGHTHAAVKKLVLVNGGADPSGRAQHRCRIYAKLPRNPVKRIKPRFDLCAICPGEDETVAIKSCSRTLLPT